jgi:hypothetical protein
VKKDFITLLIGILIGTVISTSVFVVLRLTSCKQRPQINQNQPMMNVRPNDNNIPNQGQLDDNSDNNTTNESDSTDKTN